ncbi:MAG: hypothetical protein R3B09_16025, partial [Nannocystaceae bacterium]
GSHYEESVPVVDEEGLAIAKGSEIEGAEVLPPTLAGWKRYLELGPRSGESFGTLREAGLRWWGRKIPPNLLSGARDADADADEVDEGEGPTPVASPMPVAALGTSVKESATKDVPAPTPARAGSSGDADARAQAKALVRRLNLMPQGVRLGSTRYVTPTVEAIEGDVEINFQGPVEDDGGVPLLVLRATPQGDEVQLRGELQDGNAEVTARFGPITVKRSELVILRETSLSRWFGVETTPEAKLSLTMRSALVGLEKERQEAAPDEQLTWPGVDDGTKDQLIARGLVIALENPGGFLHYRLTAKGREILDEIEATASSSQPAAPSTGSSVDDVYDKAHSELRALHLPAKQHTKFLKQVDAAIATGKSVAPVLARARKAAEKIAKGASEGRARTPEPSTLAAIVDAFDAEPRWRLTLERPRPSGYVFGVYREGADPSETVASIEVIDFEIDAARWLSDRLSLADQSEIEARLERALWAGADVDEKREESRSPIDDLIAAMERRADELGVDPRRRLAPGRTDGYASIAEALRDLSTPVGLAADELERWLEGHDFFLAAELVARSRGGTMPIDTLVRDLWSAAFDHFTVTRVKGEPGRLRVPRFAVQGQEERYVLVADPRGARPRRLWVRVRGDEDEGGTLLIDDPAGHLEAGAEVFSGDVDEALLVELYKNLSEFEEGLRRAPRTLADVRLLLYWATAMLDAPLCQGEVKRSSARALEQARGYYDAARRQLAEGQPVEAVRRMHAALRRISKAAAEIARSCAEGQLPVPGAQPDLQVTSEDAAAVGRPQASAAEPAKATASSSRRHTAVMASAAMEAFK